MNTRFVLVCALVVGTASVAVAYPTVSGRKVDKLGCYANAEQNICFIYLSGNDISVPGCANAVDGSVRWNATTSAGKNAYATAALALTHGLYVDVSTYDDCIATSGGTFAELRYISVRR